MRLVVLLVLVIAPLCACAQVRGVFYYNDNWELTTKDSAVYVRVCVFDTLSKSFIGPVRDIYRSGKIQMSGNYLAGMKKNGEFVSYYENGNQESVGQFTNNLRAGVWKSYFQNGQLKMEVNFDTKPVIVSSIYDSTGARILENGTGKWYERYREYGIKHDVIVTGELEEGKKEEQWECSLSNGDMVYMERYRKGNFISGYNYKDGRRTTKYSPSNNHLVEPFKFLVTEKFAADSHVSTKDYPFLPFLARDGKVVQAGPTNSKGTSEEEYSVVEKPAAPEVGIAGFYKAISKEIKMPTAARQAGVNGKVIVEFIVNQDGALSDFEIVNSLGHGCDEEAIRCLQAVSQKIRWKPGIQLGKPVRQRMVMAITFNSAQ